MRDLYCLLFVITAVNFSLVIHNQPMTEKKQFHKSSPRVTQIKIPDKGERRLFNRNIPEEFGGILSFLSIDDRKIIMNIPHLEVKNRIDL